MKLLTRNCEVIVFVGQFLTNKAFAAYTAVSYFPDNGIYEIDGSLIVTKVLDTTDIGTVSITKDPVSEKVYVISGVKSGGQVLNRMCDSTLFPIVPIIPSAAKLYCLSAGPNGLFAVELGALDGTLSFGKLDVTTGQWTKVSNLALTEPITALVSAQDDDGVMHIINSNGQHFVNPGSSDKMKFVQKLKFPNGLTSFCGEFDVDGTLVSTTDTPGGGISRYNFEKKTVISSILNPQLFLNDITVGLGASDSCIAPSAKTQKKKRSNKKNSKKGSKKRSGGGKKQNNKSNNNNNIETNNIDNNKDETDEEDKYSNNNKNNEQEN